MFLLKHSACPFVCEQYFVVLKSFVPKKSRIVLKNLLTNCLLLSIDKFAVISHGITQSSIIWDARCKAVGLNVRAAPDNFEYQAFITATIWLPFIVFGSGPRMSNSTIPTRHSSEIVLGVSAFIICTILGTLVAIPYSFIYFVLQVSPITLLTYRRKYAFHPGSLQIVGNASDMKYMLVVT